MTELEIRQNLDRIYRIEGDYTSLDVIIDHYGIKETLHFGVSIIKTPKLSPQDDAEYSESLTVGSGENSDNLNEAVATATIDWLERRLKSDEFMRSAIFEEASNAGELFTSDDFVRATYKCFGFTVPPSFVLNLLYENPHVVYLKKPFENWYILPNVERDVRFPNHNGKY